MLSLALPRVTRLGCERKMLIETVTLDFEPFVYTVAVGAGRWRMPCPAVREAPLALLPFGLLDPVTRADPALLRSSLSGGVALRPVSRGSLLKDGK